ncbi:Vacuolar protein sorting-associated protein 41 [Physocladia obscura]|uniref:Vacuolar protein sorting-associated protein 41 n=1 Tax=Physocladia obscura TaxID=109957 RepID=A0AAD5XF47_9FUNG|nr:Vacuolar protein sorting-associated protein 41 [Physocladia obscura]
MSEVISSNVGASKQMETIANYGKFSSCLAFGAMLFSFVSIGTVTTPSSNPQKIIIFTRISYTSDIIANAFLIGVEAVLVAMKLKLRNLYLPKRDGNCSDKSAKMTLLTRMESIKMSRSNINKIFIGMNLTETEGATLDSTADSEVEILGIKQTAHPGSETEDSDNDSNDNYDSTDDDDDDDEDDGEPMLKYQRLSGTLGDSLKKDAVSTIAVCDRFLALGTHAGHVHILDLSGNNVKKFSPHAASVTAIAIDSSAEYVASASDDAYRKEKKKSQKLMRFVSYMQAELSSARYILPMPVKCVALEPEYSKKPSRTHISGGTAEELVMTGKGWFSSFDTVLSSGEGAIWAIEWRNNYIAWANNAGVKIYDFSTSQKFAYIERPAGSPRADLFRCNLCWKDDNTLMIGWADSVKICVVKERSKTDGVIASVGNTTSAVTPVNLPSKFVEIVSEFETDFVVSGIAPLRNQIVLLSFITNVDDIRNIDVLPSADFVPEKLLSQPPEIHVVDLNGDHVANDVLSLFGYEHYRANDYRLDIVVAKPRDLDDHIEFLVSQSRYEEALLAAERATVSKKEADGSAYQGRMGVDDVVAIGLKYLKSLMDQGNFDQTAAMTSKILRQDPKLWEQWVYSFIGVNKLSILLPFIPFTEVRMNKAVYEMVLSQFLETDQKIFLSLVKAWPSELYDVSTVADGIEALLVSDPGNFDLLDAAVDLCTNSKRYDKALVFGLKRCVPKILDTIVQHNLFQTVQSNIVLMMDYIFVEVKRDEDLNGSRLWTGKNDGFSSISNTNLVDERVRIVRRAGLHSGIVLLVSNTDRAPVSSIVKQLLQTRKYLHVYLDALFRFNEQEGVQFHPLQVALYADFDPTRLIDFLRSSSAMYKVQSAYELCEIRDLVPEMVYLLGKMGNNRKALQLVIQRLGNVQQAIDFAKEQNDDVLWDDLIKYSMDKPPFIIGLLENLGSHIDPVKVIRKIPEGLPIPHLQASLIKIMTDYGIQMSLREGCAKILVSDAVKLMESLYRNQRRAICFNDLSSKTLHQVKLSALQEPPITDTMQNTIDTLYMPAEFLNTPTSPLLPAMSIVDGELSDTFAEMKDNAANHEVADLDGFMGLQDSRTQLVNKVHTVHIACPMCRV